MKAEGASKCLSARIGGGGLRLSVMGYGLPVSRFGSAWSPTGDECCAQCRSQAEPGIETRHPRSVRPRAESRSPRASAMTMTCLPSSLRAPRRTKPRGVPDRRRRASRGGAGRSPKVPASELADDHPSAGPEQAHQPCDGPIGFADEAQGRHRDNAIECAVRERRCFDPPVDEIAVRRSPCARVVRPPACAGPHRAPSRSHRDARASTPAPSPQPRSSSCRPSTGPSSSRTKRSSTAR